MRDHYRVPMRHKHISGPDGRGYTEVWIDGAYSRLQGIYSAAEALQLVRRARVRRDAIPYS